MATGFGDYLKSLKPEQQAGFQAGRQIQANRPRAINRYNTMYETDPTGANKFLANKLGVKWKEGFALSPLQRYKYETLKKTNPAQAELYRNTIRGYGGWKDKVTTAEQKQAQADAQAKAMQDQMMKTLFPEMPNYNFDPSQMVDPNLDKMYQWRIKTGQEGLDNTLASRGIFNSTAAIDASSDMISRIQAEESQKAWDRAMNTANTLFGQAQATNEYRQGNADRLERIQQAVQSQKERISNENYDRVMGVLNFLLAQNPAGISENAAKAQADLTASVGKFIAQQLGMSVGSMPNYPYPKNSSGMADIFGIGADASFNTDAMNSFGNWLASLGIEI